MSQLNVLSQDVLLTALRREGGSFRTAASAADLSARVPSCPEWTVRRLVGHLGRIYRWVRVVVEAGGAKPARPEPPARGVDILPWFDEALEALLATLAAADPDAPAWNWAGQPPVAAFWPRRMAHETAVHRWDAQIVGGLAEPVDAELAADGVSEVLDTWLPAGKGTPSGAAEGLVRLTATDLDRTWLVRLTAQGVTLLDEGTVLDDSPDAHTGVGATASDLVLALWGRLTAPLLAVEGDPARFEALRVG